MSNPLEQNNASLQVVIDKVLASDYRGLFMPPVLIVLCSIIAFPALL